jgi:hypothetical protein
VKVLHFKAVASVDEARYEFQVECEGGCDEGRARELLRSIEGQLAERNLEYAGKRKSKRLTEPVLHVMKSGWYDRAKRKQGQRLFQSKTVLLEPSEQGDETLEDSELDLTVDLE